MTEKITFTEERIKEGGKAFGDGIAQCLSHFEDDIQCHAFSSLMISFIDLAKNLTYATTLQISTANGEVTKQILGVYQNDIKELKEALAKLSQK